MVYVHPTPADCCTKVIGAVPPSAIEYATDTTRTVASLIFGSRVGGQIPGHPLDLVALGRHHPVPHQPLHPPRLGAQDGRPDPDAIQKHYYEIAQGNTPGQLAALMKLVSISQVMFGSDYPFRDAKEAVDGLVAYKFSATDQVAIDNGNALKMFPNIKI